MFKKDESRVLGKLKIEVKDKHGKVKDTREVDNLVVDTGLAFIASRMKDASATAMTHMELGTGTTAAAAGLGIGCAFYRSSSGCLHSQTGQLACCVLATGSACSLEWRLVASAAASPIRLSFAAIAQ